MLVHGYTAEASRTPGEGLLLSDGLESGGTGTWSAAVP